MGQVVTLKHKPMRERSSARVGMIVFLAAWAMMFGSLLLTFGVVRLQAEVWPPEGTATLRLWPPLWALGCILGSALAFELGRRGIRAGRGRALSAWLSVSIAGVVGFVVLLVVMVMEGRAVRLGGSYGTLTRFLVFFQLLHAGVGLPVLAVLWVRALLGRYSAASHVGVHAWVLYWWFAAATWSAIVLVVFVA